MKFLKQLFEFAPKRRPTSSSESVGGADSPLNATLKKLRRIEIVSNRMVNESFHGQYKSVFRGQGIEFDDVREYVDGDDARSIDWNVTARASKPYVKRYVEERERTLVIMLDLSASNIFGANVSRLETAAEIAASLMFSAVKNNDKVGLLTFADGVCEFYPPRKGRKYVLRLLKVALLSRPRQAPTNLGKALEFVNRTIRGRAIVFILSDFYFESLDKPLRLCKLRHDVVGVSIEEPLESTLPDLGFVELQDPETGVTFDMDTGSQQYRKAISDRLKMRRDSVIKKFKELKVDLIAVENGGDYVAPLRNFFRKRERR